MALSEDQRAMLQLLLQSGQSYGDIGSLLGSSVDEVRSRARKALTEMGGEDPDREVSLTDYLLGQADPIGRADAARHLQSDPEARALAAKLTSQLRLIAPGAELPTLPAGRERRGGTEKAASTAPATPPAGDPGKARLGRAGSAGSGTPAAAPGAALSGAQKRLIGGLAAGALVLLAVVLVLTGAFAGGEEGSSDSGGTAGGGGSSAQNASNTTSNANTVRALLKPVGSADPQAQGVAIFGQLKGMPVLQIVVKGIQPTASGQNYSIWLYRSDSAAFRLTGVRVGKSGGIATQVRVPQQVIPYVSNRTFPEIDISLANDADLKAEARKDRKLQKLTLRHIGVSVLRGPIEGPGVTTGTTLATGAAGATGASGTSGATGP